MNFTRLELHKPCTFDHWDGLDSRRGWRTIYHREGRRSARQKIGQLLDLELGSYGWHPVGIYDCGPRELFDPFEDIDWGGSDYSWPQIYDCDIPDDSPLWDQISALSKYKGTQCLDSD